MSACDWSLAALHWCAWRLACFAFFSLQLAGHGGERAYARRTKVMSHSPDLLVHVLFTKRLFGRHLA